MTHPLTPREKVARIVAPKAWTKFDRFSGFADHVAREQQVSWSQHLQPSLKAADAILEAIAPSGDQLSGNPGILKSDDHAELARLADMADWMADGDPGANGSVLLSASVASEHASDLKVLLTENAALRGDLAKTERDFSELRDSYDAVSNKLCVERAHGSRETKRATEAERKLAEAVGLLRDWMGTWFVDADSRGENAIADDTRKFLSKEAERG